MIGLLGHLFLQEYRFQFRSRLYFALLVLNSVLSLLVYRFASNALEQSSSFGSTWVANSYFEFLLIGELVLLLPLAIIESGSRAVRFSANEGLLEDLFLLPSGPLKPLMSIAFSLLLPSLIHMVMTPMFAFAFFSFAMDGSKIVLICASILASLPIFITLGIFASGILLRFGRGEGFIDHFCYVSSIFAGVYFPLAALPQHVQQAIQIGSPFAILLEHCRGLSVGQIGNWNGILILSSTGVMLLPLALWFFKRSCQRVRRGQWPHLSHT